MVIFYPFTPPLSLKIRKIKTEKIKIAGDTIISRICNKNQNHMMWGSWDADCDRQNFLLFWTIFCPFTPLKTWKIKILKNWKNTWRYYHFTHVHHKWISYDLCFLRQEHDRHNFFVIVSFFPFNPPIDRENQN